MIFILRFWLVYEYIIQLSPPLMDVLIWRLFRHQIILIFNVYLQNITTQDFSSIPGFNQWNFAWLCKLPWKMYFLFSKFDILETMYFWYVCSRSHWHKHNLLNKIEVCTLDEVWLLNRFCKVSEIEGIIALSSTVVSYGNELAMNRPFVISSWCRNSNLKNNL